MLGCLQRCIGPATPQARGTPRPGALAVHHAGHTVAVPAARNVSQEAEARYRAGDMSFTENCMALL
jgi:hypothetical protein